MQPTYSQTEIKDISDEVQGQRKVRTYKEMLTIEDLGSEDDHHNAQNEEQQCKTSAKSTLKKTQYKINQTSSLNGQSDEIKESSSQLSSSVSEVFSGKGDVKFSGNIMKNLQTSRNRGSQNQINYQESEQKIINENELKIQQARSEYGETNAQTPTQQLIQVKKERERNRDIDQLNQQNVLKGPREIGQKIQTTQVIKMNSKIKKFPKTEKNSHQSQISHEPQFHERQISPSVIKLFDQDFFNGRLSVLWIFIISQITEQLQQKLNKLFQNLTSKGYQRLVCHSVQQASQFFRAENSFFNVVSDLDNAEDLVQNRDQLNQKILSIYLYNNDPDNGIIRSMNLKSLSSKIKGFYKDLTHLIKLAKRDVDNGNKFIEDEGLMIERKYRSRLPTFIKLNNQDVSQITQYRINLYGAINLTDKQERQQKLQQFSSLVKRVYHRKPEDLQNLSDYLTQINHSVVQGLSQEQLLEKHRRILNFYVRETFYYKITNNLLRICRTVEDFRPLTLPFNQNYNAIKYFHNLPKIQEINDSQVFQLYRGSSISRNQFESLKAGDYIQLLGCISTSRSQSYTIRNFIRNHDDYLFIFTISPRNLSDDLKKFDHGFVDLSQYNIAPHEFLAQQEVLLNALNVYKIRQVIHPEDVPDRIGRIYLQYGAIFDLLERQEKQLTEQQKNVLLNYRYCMKQMNEINDQGDVFMKVQQFDKCKQFNQKKLKELEQTEQSTKLNSQIDQQTKNNLLQKIQHEKSQFFNKLANAHFSCGQTEEARLNAAKSLKSYQKGIKKMEEIQRLVCMKIFQVHEKTLKIFTNTQDTVNLTKMIDFQIEIYQHQENWFGKAQKLMQKGEIQLKQGRIIQSETHLKESEKILIDKKHSFENRRKQIQNTYFFRQMFNCFCFKNNNLNDQKAKLLRQVDLDQREFLNVKNKLHQLLLKVNECMRNVAEFIGDRKSYQDCVKKGREYFQQLNITETTNKFQVAQIKVIQAKVQNAFQKTQNVQNSYKLMEEAIKIIENINPQHQKVAQYSTLFGLFKKKQFFDSMKKVDEKSQKVKKSPYKILSQQNKSEKNHLDIEPSKSLILYDNEKPIKQNQIQMSKQKTREMMARENEQQIERQRLKRQEEERQLQRQKNFGLFNEPNHKPKYVEIINYFTKALNIIINHKTEDNPQVFQVRNYLGEVQYEFSNFRQSQKQAVDVLKTKTGLKHTQGAKSALLLAKISLSQGELKEAFQKIQKAHFILRMALVKQHNNPKYEQLYKLSPIFLQIQLCKCKIYNRQKEHDLALKTITHLKDLGRKKLRDADGVGYLADIYEQIGNTLVNKRNKFQFQDCYEKAMQLRQKQMGKYNILNAICNCSLAKYLVFTNDGQTAQKRMTDSLEIFAYFPRNHPNFWVHYSTMAFLSHHNQDKENEMAFLRNSVKLIEKRYSKNHINLLKLKVRLAQVLINNDSDEEALKIFEHLQRQLQGDVSLSQRGENLRDTENQKIAVRDVVDRKIQETRLRITQIRSRVNIQLNESPRIEYQDKHSNHELKDLQRTNAKLMNESSIHHQVIDDQFQEHGIVEYESPRRDQKKEDIDDQKNQRQRQISN